MRTHSQLPSECREAIDHYLGCGDRANKNWGLLLAKSHEKAPAVRLRLMRRISAMPHMALPGQTYLMLYLQQKNNQPKNKNKSSTKGEENKTIDVFDDQVPMGPPPPAIPGVPHSYDMPIANNPFTPSSGPYPDVPPPQAPMPYSSSHPYPASPWPGPFGGESVAPQPPSSAPYDSSYISPPSGPYMPPPPPPTNSYMTREFDYDAPARDLYPSQDRSSYLGPRGSSTSHRQSSSRRFDDDTFDRRSSSRRFDDYPRRQSSPRRYDERRYDDYPRRRPSVRRIDDDYPTGTLERRRGSIHPHSSEDTRRPSIVGSSRYQSTRLSRSPRRYNITRDRSKERDSRETRHIDWAKDKSDSSSEESSSEMRLGMRDSEVRDKMLVKYTGNVLGTDVPRFQVDDAPAVSILDISNAPKALLTLRKVVFLTIDCNDHQRHGGARCFWR